MSLRSFILFGFLVIVMSVPISSYSCGGMSGMPCHGNVQANMPGATLFQTKNCSSCHTIGGGNSAGPDLKGLFKLHNEDWVRKMIMNPNKMTIKDPAAVQLKTQFGMQMPNANLTPAELDQLVEYLKVATQ